MPIAPNLQVTITPRPIQRPKVIPAAPAAERKKPVVCGYARVSRIEMGENSLQNQIAHLESAIKSNPDYTPGRVYHDDGISGTQAHNRPALQQLLADCREGLCQIIIVKSVSRLARSTEDLLTIVRELSSIGVTVIFEEEGIRTDQLSSSFLLSLTAMVAEYESKSIGSNVMLGHRNRFKLGTHKPFHAPYGYDKVDGKLVINEEEAKIVREIFQRIQAGEGGMRIARDLDARGVPTKHGGRWDPNTVHSVTKNALCMGTMVNQKFYNEGHKSRINRGKVDMFFTSAPELAIVEEETYDRVHEIIANRRQKYKLFMLEEDEESVFYRMQRTCFSSHMFCNSCGSTLQRSDQFRSGPDVDPAIGKGWYWTCSKHKHYAHECSMTRVKEADITRAFLNMVNKLIYSQTTDLPLLDIFIEAQLGDEADQNAEVLKQLSDELQKIEYERQSAIDLAMRSAIAPSAFKARISSLDIRENEIKQAQMKLAKSHSVQETEKLKTLLSDSASEKSAGSSDRVITTFDEVLFAGIVESVTVQARQFVTFELKCGLRLTEYFATLSNYPELSSPSGCSASDSNGESEERVPIRLPYGYKRVNDKIEVIPEEADKIKTFFNLIASGASIPAAGTAAGIPRKGSALYKIAHRKAYGGTALYPSIVDPKMIYINSSRDRRVSFVPLYSAFEYGMIPAISQEKGPSECIEALYGEITPVAVFQPPVADFPRVGDAEKKPTIPAELLRFMRATTSTPTAPTDFAQQPDEKGASQKPSNTDDAGDATDIILPVAKTSSKKRVVDLAIEMHNKRLAKPVPTSVAPATPSVKDKIMVTVIGKEGKHTYCSDSTPIQSSEATSQKKSTPTDRPAEFQGSCQLSVC